MTAGYWNELGPNGYRMDVRSGWVDCGARLDGIPSPLGDAVVALGLRLNVRSDAVTDDRARYEAAILDLAHAQDLAYDDQRDEVNAAAAENHRQARRVLAVNFGRRTRGVFNFDVDREQGREARWRRIWTDTVERGSRGGPFAAVGPFTAHMIARDQVDAVTSS